jgi:isopenicillin-N N-acyltransferase like protein
MPFSWLLVPLALSLPPFRVAETFRYPEAKHGKGSLKYINGLPVLTLEGTPEEIGEQHGVLALKPASKLLQYPRELLKAHSVEIAWPLIVRTAKSMYPQFPVDFRKELESAAGSADVDKECMIVGNTMFDIKKFIACSTLVVDADHSATKQPLFGRNLDFPTLGYLHHYTVVEVCRPEGKHPFVSIGFPGMLGCLSGMNDAGLTVAVLEVYASGDDSTRLDPKGVPYALCFRRVLEDCTTIDEAEKALKEMKRTTMVNLAVCDRIGSAVFEITPKTVNRRPAEKGICACTNHFRTKGLSLSTECGRYECLEKCQDMKELGLEDIAKKLHAVNQGADTLQTMIFEPATLKLHLAFGKCPSSELPMRELDLAPLLKKKETSKK